MKVKLITAVYASEMQQALDEKEFRAVLSAGRDDNIYWAYIELFETLNDYPLDDGE